MRLYIYLNEQEKDIIKAKCEKLDISQSSYAREIILNLDYIENKELFEELHRIGSNLNQIAHALNMDITQSNSEILAVFQSLQELLKEYKSFMMSSKYPKLLKKRKFGNEE